MITTAAKRFFGDHVKVVGAMIGCGVFSAMVGDTVKGFLVSAVICTILAIGIEMWLITKEKTE